MAILANELRIGNIIKDEKNKGYDVSLSLIALVIDDPNHFYGIPLTEEWLLELGFEKIRLMAHGGDFIIKEFLIQIRGLSISISNNHGYLTDLKYVHQLQNLYFALTGEELILT